MELQVIDGRLSPDYNHFAEFKFTECLATNTRLMGVVAMRITWTSDEDLAHRYVQIIHLDYSEYGIDDYFEYEIDPEDGPERCEEIGAEIDGAWIAASHDLGGSTRRIDAPIAMKLIDDACEIARTHVMQDSDMYYDFRQDAIIRFGLMKEALESDGLLDAPATSEQAINAVRLHGLSTFQTINYFIIRLVDNDFDCAKVLSTMSREELMDQQVAKAGIQSLIRNAIGSRSAGGFVADDSRYEIESITLAGRYQYYTSSIELTGVMADLDRKVTSLRTGFAKTLSDYEAAHMLDRPEYITVYDVPDAVLANFDKDDIDILRNTTPKLVNNGWRIPVYQEDNSHVDKAIYRIGDDIIGSVLVSIPGELILMSHKLMGITSLEASVNFSIYGDKLILKNRFKVLNSIFETICDSTGTLIEDLLDIGGDDE